MMYSYRNIFDADVVIGVGVQDQSSFLLNTFINWNSRQGVFNMGVKFEWGNCFYSIK